jgi:hypothetical protein
MANTTLDVIRDILILGVTPITLAIIAYKQVVIGNRQKVIHRQIDGMKSELVTAVAGRNKAEGQLEGLAQGKQEVVDAAKVVEHDAVQKVKIVEQSKAVDVKVEKDKSE